MSNGGHFSMKHFYHATLMVHSFTTLPASLVVFIYSIGALVLTGNLILFQWAFVAFVFSTLLQGALGIVSE